MKGYLIVIPKHKIRTDYNRSFSLQQNPVTNSYHWLTAILMLALGFVLGLLYQKQFIASPCEILALTHVGKPEIEFDNSTQSVAKKGVNSAKA